MSMNLHVDDCRFFVEVVTAGKLDWSKITAVAARVRAPSGVVIVPTDSDMTLDTTGKRVLWRPQPGNLPEKGYYRMNVFDITGGIQMVIADYDLLVLDVIRVDTVS